MSLVEAKACCGCILVVGEWCDREGGSVEPCTGSRTCRAEVCAVCAVVKAVEVLHGVLVPHECRQCFLLAWWWVGVLGDVS